MTRLGRIPRQQTRSHGANQKGNRPLFPVICTFSSFPRTMSSFVNPSRIAATHLVQFLMQTAILLPIVQVMKVDLYRTLNPETSCRSPVIVTDYCSAILNVNRELLEEKLKNNFFLLDVVAIARSLRCRPLGSFKIRRARTKNDLAPWLISIIRNTCRSLCDGSFLNPQLPIPTRFTLCSSPGSLDSVRKIKSVFKSVFSDSFMSMVSPQDQIHPPKADSDWPQIVSDARKGNVLLLVAKQQCGQPPSSLLRLCTRASANRNETLHNT